MLGNSTGRIIYGDYDFDWPEKPIEPTVEELNDLPNDSELLWERYYYQLDNYKYHEELNEFR